MKHREPTGLPRTRRSRVGWPGLVNLAGVAMVLSAAAVRRMVVRVDGPSMAPVLSPGDLVLTVPVAWTRSRAPSVGEVVVATDPTGRAVLKRVAAVAGEWADLGGVPGLVPAGHVALAGDNPARSTDSRRYGAIAVDAVTARARWAVTGAGSRRRIVRISASQPSSRP